MPESSPTACLAAMRRAASSSAFVQCLLLISSDVTLLRFPRGDDTDDRFAIFTLPVHVRNHQQDGSVRGGLRDPEGDPPLLSGMLVDTIQVNKAAFVFEDQRSQF